MLSVLMATHDGASTLPEVLDAYCRLVAPVGGWHCVIVDNGSADSTKDIIESYLERLPLTYVFESVQGKNAALNTGLAMVKGDLVIFTDDDAIPHPDWLCEMRSAADANPSFSIFGGAIIPRWELQPEPWLTSWVQLGPVFSLTDPTWREGPVPPYFVFGPNMAIRASVFEAGYRYDTTIGPRPGQYAMGSESELTSRLSKAGFTAWFCKKALVEHIIRRLQMERRWILRRGIRYGRGKYRWSIQQENVGRKKLFGVPGYLLRELVKKALIVARAKFSGDDAEFFECRWVFNYLLGQAIEAHEIYLELQGTGTVESGRAL